MEEALDRFYVKARSVNAVRRALGRAPGGVRVVGRFDRETIECSHTMEAHSLGRFWSIIVSRLENAGLTVVPRPGQAPAARDEDWRESGEDLGDRLAGGDGERAVEGVVELGGRVDAEGPEEGGGDVVG